MKKTIVTNSKFWLYLLLFVFLPFSHSVYAQLNCRTVETLGTAQTARVLMALNSEFEDREIRINRRKRIQIQEITRVNFRGCQARITARVIVRRRWRRNARGTVIFSTEVERIALPQICVNNTRVRDVNLSNLTALGEALYERVANWFIPEGFCVTLP